MLECLVLGLLLGKHVCAMNEPAPGFTHSRTCVCCAGGGRDCAEKFECEGNGTCTPYEMGGKGGVGCTANTSLGTFVNVLYGPAANRAVTAASACSVARCGGHGRCFACPEPFDDPAGFAKCKCDCDDTHDVGPACGSGSVPSSRQQPTLHERSVAAMA